VAPFVNASIIITKPHEICIFHNNFRDRKGTRMADPTFGILIKTWINHCLLQHFLPLNKKVDKFQLYLKTAAFKADIVIQFQ
jgi:hypothetical protein